MEGEGRGHRAPLEGRDRRAEAQYGDRVAVYLGRSERREGRVSADRWADVGEAGCRLRAPGGHGRRGWRQGSAGDGAKRRDRPEALQGVYRDARYADGQVVGRDRVRPREEIARVRFPSVGGRHRAAALLFSGGRSFFAKLTNAFLLRCRPRAITGANPVGKEVTIVGVRVDVYRQAGA